VLLSSIDMAFGPVDTFQPTPCTYYHRPYTLFFFPRPIPPSRDPAIISFVHTCFCEEPYSFWENQAHHSIGRGKPYTYF
jgi:hypothetical protein